MKTPTKIITALALAGIAVAGGAAFTAGGLTDTAAGTQFIGGQATQTVNGATLKSISYDFADSSARTLVKTIVLTFDETTGKVLPNENQVTINLNSLAGTYTGTGGSFAANPAKGTHSNDLAVYTYTWTPSGTTGTADGFAGLNTIVVSVADNGVLPTIVVPST
jgi:hypothetical protein